MRRLLSGDRPRVGIGQVAGETHPAAKFPADVVALARLLARDRSQPRGWIKEMASAHGASRGALCMAIGGYTWADMHDPAPVRSFARTRPVGRPDRPLCPSCGREKYRDGCNHRFHSIDHRAGGRSRRSKRIVS